MSKPSVASYDLAKPVARAAATRAVFTDLLRVDLATGRGTIAHGIAAAEELPVESEEHHFEIDSKDLATLVEIVRRSCKALPEGK